MNVFYSDHYTYPLPPGHQFPAEKYSRLRFALLDLGVLKPEHLFKAQPATPEQIQMAHAAWYYDAVCSGRLDDGILRRLGLPWSEELVVRAHGGVGGMIQAARAALRCGFGGALSGGTHHAFSDDGRGFCVFNDTAVAVLTLLQSGEISRCAVVDLDAHQGNGTAEILQGRREVFILDVHGAKSYPVRKVPASLDVALPEDVEDEAYLRSLVAALPAVLDHRPDLIFYIAGVDPLQGDRFGKMALSMQGLRERDRMVFELCSRSGIPVAISMGGGYAQPIELTVAAHVNTYREARSIFGGSCGTNPSTYSSAS